MTTKKPPEYGDPFLLLVTEGRLDNSIEVEDLGIIRRCSQERSIIKWSKAEVQEFGGAQRVYMCIPIGRVWTDDPGAEDDSTNAPNRVVQHDIAGTDIERMAAAAAAMGGGKLWSETIEP